LKEEQPIGFLFRCNFTRIGLLLLLVKEYEYNTSFIHSFFPDISIATLLSPLLLIGAPIYSIDTVSELMRQSATGNYE